MATLEVPLANAIGSPKRVPRSYHFKIPVRPLYKSYPVHAPGHEPPATWIGSSAHNGIFRTDMFDVIKDGGFLVPTMVREPVNPIAVVVNWQEALNR